MVARLAGLPGGERLALRRCQRPGRRGEPGGGRERAPDASGCPRACTRTGARARDVCRRHRAPPGGGAPPSGTDAVAVGRRDCAGGGTARRRGGRLPQLPGMSRGPRRGAPAVRRERGGAGGGRRSRLRGDPARRPGNTGPTSWWGRGRRSVPRSDSAVPTSVCSRAPSRRSAGSPDASSARRSTARGRARVRDHAPCPRAGHPAGEGHLQRVHEPDPDGGHRSRATGVARDRGPRRGGAALRPRHPVLP